MAEVFILLGGNVGDMAKILGIARKLIGERIGLITQKSSIYATESWGFESRLFWNQIIVAETIFNPFELLNMTQSIEREMGRTKKSLHSEGLILYEDRIIDIDLIFYDNLVIATKDLTLPHPKIGERRFVLIPLNELAPEKCHPVSGMKIKELLQLCPDKLKVVRVD